ncbi:MAG TPA: 4'-phosphopantetheinyl transferase superfamily protein [Chthonomonadaceae bacterium]|nr:4'-phosphopantetheinyl transferase superfamily protein [Chthonomonadaceae bacterium]
MTPERRHASALAWRAEMTIPHALIWLESQPGPAASALSAGASRTEASREADFVRDRLAAQRALNALFATSGFPAESAEHLHWQRDAWGKPYVEWSGPVAEWAAASRVDSRLLHVSNTHDGPAHIVFAAYAESLAGIGVDVVHLPRLRLPGKGVDYLHRFARKFMAEEEYAALRAGNPEDDAERLLVRVAAHFSLMEAASKACGTGLKIGAGMGRPTSLPKQSLGALQLEPSVSLLFGPEAQARLSTLGATRHAGYWGASEEYLVSAVLLRR